MENEFLKYHDTPSLYFIFSLMSIIVINSALIQGVVAVSVSQSINLLPFWTSLSPCSKGRRRRRRRQEQRPRITMMMMRRRLACCTRDRETSIDFDEHESKISLPCSSGLFYAIFLDEVVFLFCTL